MQLRAPRALLFVAAALAAGALLVASIRDEAVVAEAALAAVPEDAIVVATVDLDSVRASSVLSPLVREGREIPGIGKLDEVCGFDPVGRLRELVLAIPAGAEDELGVVATGAIEAAPLVACASKLVAKRGGEPIVETSGSFTVVRDARGVLGRIAVRNGGPVLLGEGAYLQKMMRAAEGAEPNVSRSIHAKLRSEVDAGAIRMTFIVPAEMKQRVRAELGDIDVPALSIHSGAVVVSTSPTIRIRALANCENEQPCAKLSESLNGSLAEGAKDLGVRLLGMGKLMERVRISSKDERLELQADLTAEEASGLVDRLLALRALRRPAPLPTPDAANELPPSADEVVTPRRN